MQTGMPPLVVVDTETTVTDVSLGGFVDEAVG